MRFMPLSLFLSLSLVLPRLPRLPPARSSTLVDLLSYGRALAPCPLAPLPPCREVRRAGEGGTIAGGNNNREWSKAPLGGINGWILETVGKLRRREIPKSLTRCRRCDAQLRFPGSGSRIQAEGIQAPPLRSLVSTACTRRHSCRIPIGTQLCLFTRSLLGSPLLATTTTCSRYSRLGVPRGGIFSRFLGALQRCV